MQSSYLDEESLQEESILFSTKFKKVRTMSNFRKVVQFHENFGHPVNKQGFDWLEPEREELRKTLIREEFNEVLEAFEKRDAANLAKEVGDLLYVVYGLAAELGIDIDMVVARIHQSNMSKICKSMEEAIEGVEMYRANGIEVDVEENDDGTFTLFREEDGKILKGPRYEEPQLNNLLLLGIQDKLNLIRGEV